MKFETMSTSPRDYVVLDVETNGLSSKEYDLLSVTFYRPDNGRMYNRFLPLELNDHVFTTHISASSGEPATSNPALRKSSRAASVSY